MARPSDPGPQRVSVYLARLGAVDTRGTSHVALDADDRELGAFASRREAADTVARAGSAAR